MKNKNKWRLPTADELVELYKSGRFKSDNYYWSSTTYASDTSCVWVVSFKYGLQNRYTKTSSNYVVCVKTKKSGKLKWQKDISKIKMTWFEATEYADKLNKKELK